MDNATTDLAARFLEGIGLADAPLAAARMLMPTFPMGRSESFRFIAEATDIREAIGYLSALTVPATRHVLFATPKKATAFVNNSRNGSDYADYTFLIPRHLNCRFARIVNQKPHIWRNGKHREIMKYEARIFDLHDSAGETIRSVCCANDGGRWVFDTFGTPHPIESGFHYDAKRKATRFTADHLSQLAKAFGLAIPSCNDFQKAGHYLLYAEERSRVLETCTVEEEDDPAYGYYRRGMGWVKHMTTHAESVIHDFEKCIELNPAYEPRVREYLDLARQRISEYRGN